MADKKETAKSKCDMCGALSKVIKHKVGKTGKGEINLCERCYYNIEYGNSFSLAESLKQPKKNIITSVLSPKEIKEHLDKYVVGQEKTKRSISIAVYNHYKRIMANDNVKNGDEDVELEKSNILLIGPTGSGKTLIAKTLAKILDVPFAMSDATTLTQAGYVGEDVENILLKLYQAADGNIERCERGIIYVDEIDKIGRTTGNVSMTRDVSGEGVQQSLLKIIEGTVSNVSPEGGRKHPQQNFLQINTSNILFICGGAFSGLDGIIGRRTSVKSLGFGADIKSKLNVDESAILSKVTPHDLVTFGLIPEFVGRLPICATLNKLDKKQMVNILTEPKNAILKQYKKMFSLDNVELEFTNSAIEQIADMAIEHNTGARGLRSVIEETMLDIMYELPSLSNKFEKVIIDYLSNNDKQGFSVRWIKRNGIAV